MLSLPQASAKPRLLVRLGRVLLPAVLAAVVVVLGFVVMAGWWQQSALLVQVVPGYTPMQFNTALCFLGSGAGLLFALSGFRRVAAGIGAAVLLIAGFTLLQYIFGVDFGLDELFVEHFLDDGTSHRGRMAPNTATCFILFGIWLVIEGLFPRRQLAASAGLVLAPAILGLAVLSLIGYLTGLEALFGWSQLTRMAVHTTVGFLLLGTAASLTSWRSESRLGLSRSYAYIAPAVIGSLTLLIGVWIGLDHTENDRVTQRMRADLNALVNTYELTLLAEVRALDRLGTQLSLEDGNGEPGWNPVALQAQLDDAVSLRSVRRIGMDATVRNRLPAGSAPAIASALRAEGLEQAHLSRQSWLSRPLETAPGEVAVVAYTPLYRAGVPSGALESVLVLEPVLAAARPVVDLGHVLRLDKRGETLISLPEGVPSGPVWIEVAESAPVRNRTFDLTLSVPVEARGQIRSYVPELVLFVGMVVTGLVGLTIHFLHASRETERLRRINAELERANRELDEFAYAASHDLKAPLRGVRQLLAWIRADLEGRFDSQTDRYLSQADRRIDRLQSLLESILAYSRLGRQARAGDRFDPARVIPETVALSAPPDGVTVTPDIAAGMTLGERALFEGVLINLLSNAWRHHDRETVDIRITARPDGDVCRIGVSDDGPGIPPEFHSRIFKMFQTLKPRDELEASGMGLALVKKSVERVGGRVRIESDPEAGRGTTVWLNWPLEKTHGR